MVPRTRVNYIWARFGTSPCGARPAATLREEMPGLTDYFQRLLKKDPARINCNIELEGFAATRISFQKLRPTIALLVIHPHKPEIKRPDALCLLVNGLEDREDVDAVKAKVKFPRELWNSMDKPPKARPVTVAAFNVNGRLRDPATITVIHVVANVYFNLFGTNALSEES